MSRRIVAASVALAAILAVGGFALVRTGVAADLVTAGSPGTSSPTATSSPGTTAPPPARPSTSPSTSSSTRPSTSTTTSSTISTPAAPNDSSPAQQSVASSGDATTAPHATPSTERSSTGRSWTTIRSLDAAPASPPPSTIPDPVHDPAVVDPATCPEVGRSAVIDRDRQLGWLCEDGTPAHLFPVTTQRVQPDPGDYAVDAKDLQASSTISGEYTTMTHFVVFTRGKFAGARIGFHSVPKARDGSWVQPLETVGDLAWIDASSGCIRVLPDDAVRIWDWLDLGGSVRVVT